MSLLPAVNALVERRTAAARTRYAEILSRHALPRNGDAAALLDELLPWLRLSLADFRADVGAAPQRDQLVADLATATAAEREASSNLDDARAALADAEQRRRDERRWSTSPEVAQAIAQGIVVVAQKEAAHAAAVSARHAAERAIEKHQADHSRLYSLWPSFTATPVTLNG